MAGIVRPTKAISPGGDRVIGSISEGRGFKGCLKYLLEKEKGELIGGNMVGQTPQELAKEFKLSRQLNPTIQRPVFHVSISLVNRPDYRESLSDQRWNSVAQKYLERMGFDDNQYVVVRHHDTDHDHIHMVASRGRLDGKAVNVWQSKHRTEKILRQLEQEYNLTPVLCSWEVLQRSQVEGQYQKQRQELEQGQQPDTDLTRTIQARIDLALSECTAVSELTERLQQMGVETRLRTKRDGSINGISYHCQELSATGYKLGRGYTWAAISSRLERNHSRVQAEEARVSAQRQQAEEAARLEALRQQAEEAARQSAQQREQQRQRELEQLHQAGVAAKREEIKAAGRLLAAEETLKLKRQVDSYFQAAPPNCSDSEIAPVDYQHRYCNERLGQAYEKYETLNKQVTSANFWQKLLPQYERNLAQLKEKLSDWQSAITQKQSVEKQLLELQQTLRRYKEWEQSPSTQEMRRMRDYLQTPESQQLIAEALELELKRELVRQRELERQRQRDHTLNQLQQWYKNAQKLKRPSEYLNRIVEIQSEFRAGTPLSEKAIAAMKTDREEELRQQRGRGFSR